MSDGYSVANAARLLGVSVSTISRRLDNRELKTVPNQKPRRVDSGQVDQERAELLQKLGAVEAVSAATRPADAGSQAEDPQKRIAELEGALTDLVTAHSAVLDTFRRLSGPGVPNG